MASTKKGKAGTHHDRRGRLHPPLRRHVLEGRHVLQQVRAHHLCKTGESIDGCKGRMSVYVKRYQRGRYQASIQPTTPYESTTPTHA